MDIREIGLMVLIITLVVLIGAAVAKDNGFHCEVHGPVSQKELIAIGCGDYTDTFCIKCIVDFATENLPEIYRVTE